MAYDAAAFETLIFGGRVPAEVGPGCVAAVVQADRVRTALDVALEDAEGRRVVAFLERRVEGAECLVSTGCFNVSYYPAGDMTDAEAAGMTRALAELIRRREDELGLDAVRRVLTHGHASPTDVGASETLELRINRECNERCMFCNTPEDSDAILPGAAAVLALLEAERAAGTKVVLITGREPTLDPRLVEYVRRARELGYERIRLQTNATRLADRAYLDELVAAGLTEVEISLHTRDRRTFLKLVGKPSLLERTERGIANALDAELRCHLVMVATNKNLGQLPGLLSSVGRDYGGRLGHVTLSPMAPVGDGRLHLDLVPRLSDMARALPAIFRAARAVGIEMEIPSRCGMPLCTIPEDLRAHSAESRNAPGLTLEASKQKGESCGDCRYDAVCTGAWSAYVERHGTGELLPVPRRGLPRVV